MKKLIVFCAVIILFGTLYSKADIQTAAFNMPGAWRAWVNGAGGNNLGGCFRNGFLNHHRFLYNDGTWSTFDATDAYAMYVDGSNIGGIDGRGFFYNTTDWNIIDVPGTGRTEMHLIDRYNFDGIYYDFFGENQGTFIFVIPAEAGIQYSVISGIPPVRE